ncbi:hypothetical protein RchiOBHm_Chr4g0424061 [Rosa chinensis]|uniref:Uncharacterized protein n=1 Tax=Rosa chinensis TaxID=74649 RepID=A0A2P6QYS0_ROSCH|nr:hypothetical protein RchiOBHm_Chr4g0424061 [Rosa chinensis]
MSFIKYFSFKCFNVRNTKSLPKHQCPISSNRKLKLPTTTNTFFNPFNSWIKRLGFPYFINKCWSHMKTSHQSTNLINR